MCIERLHHYFVTNDIGEDKHVDVLLVQWAGKCSLMHRLTAPHRPAEKTFAEIVQVM